MGSNPATKGKICGAEKSGGRGPCLNPAGYGTDHAGYGRCKYHFGSTPALKQSAAREKAQAYVVAYGLPRDVDPFQALGEEIARTAGHVAWLDAKIGQMDEAELTQWSQTGQRPSAWVEMYWKERDQLAKVSKLAIDAGIAERLVKVYEVQAVALVSAITEVLQSMGLEEAQIDAARRGIASRLREVAA